ncbi:calcium-binding and coiled-coil domain-containing protein 2-like [Hydra vulgaris]|uniref:Calcium-binding and coiled-coil domain-containing protein 2-like n=1 Tax=Hydra vulgaris TaxID=6087 RepID=A0ABM4BAA3_HYDVU
MNMVRKIFQEMFIKQQNDILKIISGNLKLTNDRIDILLKEANNSKEKCDLLEKENGKLKAEFKILCERMKILENVNKNIEESLTVTQDIQEKKVTELEKKINIKNSLNGGENIKLRQLEDRLRRNNLRIDGITENENENWDDTEKKVISLFENNLSLSNINIERAHRTGKKDGNKSRTIVVILLHYKDKVKALHAANKLKGSGMYINEDFSFETNEIRKKLVDEMKLHRKNGKYSIIIYDKLIVKEFKNKQPSY